MGLSEIPVEPRSRGVVAIEEQPSTQLLNTLLFLLLLLFVEKSVGGKGSGRRQGDVMGVEMRGSGRLVLVALLRFKL